MVSLTIHGPPIRVQVQNMAILVILHLYRIYYSIKKGQKWKIKTVRTLGQDIHDTSPPFSPVHARDIPLVPLYKNPTPP